MEKNIKTDNPELTLDPKDWDEMRKLGHQMMDDVMNYLQNIRREPVWRKIPDEVKIHLQEDVPQEPQPIEDVYRDFKQNVFPYTKGNIHPRFFSWVQGTGTPFGVLADMLASTMNPNVTIGEHAPMYVDKQVVNWCKKMLNYPSSASGILLSGGSMANITALIVARNNQLKKNVRKEGLNAVKSQMTLYCSSETHSCIQKAVEALGLGADAIRSIAVDENNRINNDVLERAIQNDIKNGFTPFCIVGNAGTVNTGAIDDLDHLAAISNKYDLWFHVDGAYGALAKLTPGYAVQLKAIEKADSVAFDLHKWLFVPYEVGCALIRNAEAHRNSFALTPNYLLNGERGLAGGPDPINNYGLELSRGFKALKIWMSLKENGLKKYAAIIGQNIAQALYLAERVTKENCLELLAPVSLSIVCFRFRKDDLTNDELNALNREIIFDLQESGIASPSSTILGGKYAIRVCIVNHRSVKEDLDVLISETLRIGNEKYKSLKKPVISINEILSIAK
ncbi:MAG TPA: pyridoxal-dependent decarboxylase [Mucilaginibacter sp.]|jgi:glutamate/tyrosine decarboxylase-like PLP-dependent enzyme|nr:pyridoxal-dependent decarboxylase [Mucilaginibacter sp.]